MKTNKSLVELLESGVEKWKEKERARERQVHDEKNNVNTFHTVKQVYYFSVPVKLKIRSTAVQFGFGLYSASHTHKLSVQSY